LCKGIKERLGFACGRNYLKLKAHLFCSPVGDVFAAVDEEGALVHFHFLGQRKPADSEKKLKASGCSITWSADALGEVAKPGG
jgi:hypothetical protein